MSSTFIGLLLCISSVVCVTEYCTNNYCTYIHGDPGSNVVIGAPHGGDVAPSASILPDRENGCFVSGACVWNHVCSPRDAVKCQAKVLKDSYTKEIALRLADELSLLTGKRPHVVINELHRVKLDPNRPKDEAAQGALNAEVAFDQFHGFIGQAKAAIVNSGIRTGLYLDIHGQEHEEGWVELGYLVTKERLNSDTPVAMYSSLRSLDVTLPISFNELLRGYSSLGFFLQDLGISTVPSPAIPKPISGNYYSGDYDVETHGSRYQGHFDAIQIETPSQYRTATTYVAYTINLASAVNRFLAHYNYPTSFCAKDYCQYLPGDAGTNIIINAARGGEMLPPSIPDRTSGCTVSSACVWSHTCGTKDVVNCAAGTSKMAYTKEVAVRLADELKILTGKRPHVIINDLHRLKMDGDAEVNEATFGVLEAVTAYNEYHAFITQARSAISGPGLLIDVQGHSNTEACIQLGYLVSKTRLNNAGLLLESYASTSSVKSLDISVPASFEALIRGSSSLGYFMQNPVYYYTVPSPATPRPGAITYSIGGYCVATYGSKNGGAVDAILVNAHSNFRALETYEAFAHDLADAVSRFRANYLL